MKKLFVLMFAAAMVSVISGCGGAASAGKDQVAALNEMATILDGVKDDKSADEALPKLDKAAAKAREAGEKVASTKMSSDDATKYAKELGDAQAKLQASTMKAALAAPGKGKQLTEALGKAQPKVKLP